VRIETSTFVKPT